MSASSSARWLAGVAVGLVLVVARPRPPPPRRTQSPDPRVNRALGRRKIECSPDVRDDGRS